MATNQHYLEFNIVEVANAVGLQFIKNGPHGEFIYRCPFCGDSLKSAAKGHLYLNPSTGEYHCMKCGAGGYTIGFYARLRGIDTAEAYKELSESAIPRVNLLDTPKRREFALKADDMERRDEIYSSFLRMLPLYARHKKDLLRRGLSEEDIAIKEFKSLPDDPKTRWNICNELASRYSLKGIPGFEKKTSRKGSTYWDCMKGPGYLIPVRNVAGKIAAFQIRRDNPGLLTIFEPGIIVVEAKYMDKNTGEIIAKKAEVSVPGYGKISGNLVIPNTKLGASVQLHFIVNGTDVTQDCCWSVNGPAIIGSDSRKYLWFSTPDNPVNAMPHIVNPGSEKVWITEGPLKAEVASKYLGTTFIGVPGIGCWRPVRKIMSELGARTYVLAYDQDNDPSAQNAVKKSSEYLIADLKEAGITGEVASWDRSLGKGIDDVVLTLKHRHMKISEATFLNSVRIKKTTTTEVEVEIPQKVLKDKGFIAKLKSLFRF